MFKMRNNLYCNIEKNTNNKVTEQEAAAIVYLFNNRKDLFVKYSSNRYNLLSKKYSNISAFSDYYLLLKFKLKDNSND